MKISKILWVHNYETARSKSGMPVYRQPWMYVSMAAWLASPPMDYLTEGLW